MRLRRHIRLILASAAIALAMVAGAVEAACGLIPNEFVAASGNGGLKLGDNISVNGNPVTGSTSGHNIVLRPDGSLEQLSQELPDLVPPTFPANTVNNDINVADEGVRVIDHASETFYDRIRGGEEVTIRFQGGGPLHIDALEVGQNSRLIFEPGIYYIDDLGLGEGSQIEVTGPEVILHIGSNFELAENTQVNDGGSVTDLQVMIHSNAKVDIAEGSDMTGIIYGPDAGNIDIEENVSFRGTILSDGKVDIEDNAVLTLTEEDRIAIGSISTCTEDPVLGSFAIDIGEGLASTCVAEGITITALDTDGIVLESYAGTINISTTTGKGDWSVANATNEVTPSGSDQGAATYTFDPLDASTIDLNLSNRHAQSVSITVTDADTDITTTSGPLSFSDNAFIISSTESFADPVAGRNHAFKVEVYTRDTTSPPLPAAPVAPCQIATEYAGTIGLQAAYVPEASHPAGALAPTISAVADGSGSLSPAPGSAGLSMEFVDGRSDFVLQTSDVGRFSLRLTEDASGFADAPISGDSAVMTVRPFGLKIRPDSGLPSPPGTTATGDVFASAGDAFAVTVSAMLWQGPADTLDANGNPVDIEDVLDNTGVAPGFAATTGLSASLNTPVDGIAGALNRIGGTLPLAAVDFTAGSTTALQLTYAEVGSMRILADVADYLGSGIALSGTSAIIGRFKPHHFELSLRNAPSWQAACTVFTYMGQEFDFATAPTLRLSAHNADHAVTVNYASFTGDDWWNVDNADLSLTLSDPAAGAGITLERSMTGTGLGDIENPSPTSAGFVDFQFQGPLTYTKPTVTAHTADAGYATFNANPTLTLSYSGLDGDDEGDLVVAPAESLAPAVDASGVRHGRLRMVNANGSELLDLALPLQLEYFNDNAWTRVTDDLCTASFQVSDFTYTPATRPADTTSAFAAGVGALDYLCATTTCATGDVEIRADLNDTLGTGTAAQPWLLYDWDLDGSAEDPAATASFGIFEGNDKHIYLRELY